MIEPTVSGGLLVVISAPSGAGKGTIRKCLMNEWSGLSFCPSVTTRKPRKGEVQGEDYYFVSLEEFEDLVRRGQLVEWACVYGNMYGTPRRPLEEELQRGRVVLVEKDVQGAATLRKVYPNGVYVFVVPPNREELERRMRSRGTETQEELCTRLGNVWNELQQLGQYDYVIVNDDVDQAKQTLKCIIVAELCKVSRRADILTGRGWEGWLDAETIHQRTHETR
ncbi:MAG: guanylate kinase [Bacillota bacterium]